MKGRLKYILILATLILSGIAIYLLKKGIEKNTIPDTTAVCIDWYNEALHCEQFTEGFTVPVAAYFYGYMGLLGKLAHSYQINDFKFFHDNYPDIEIHDDIHSKIELNALLNEAYYTFIKKYNLSLSPSLIKDVDDLHAKWEKKFVDSSFKKSKELGVQLADDIFMFESKDSMAYQAYLHNFSREYIPPVGDFLWTIDSEHPMPALLPYWGSTKTLIPSCDTIMAKPLPALGYDESSQLFTQGLEIFTLTSPLSYENKWISEFWSDDIKGLTFTPAGRWISISNQVIQLENPEVGKLINTYLVVGLALHDAAIVCWKEKYHYNLERPEAYIRKVFNDNWRSSRHAPNHPSYPSGHSIFGMASAEVLTHLYGNKYKFTDRSHEGRNEFIGKPRSFNSFYEMAFENAYSRILLGVHFRMDCTEGIRLGLLVGKAVNSLDIGDQKQISLN